MRYIAVVVVLGTLLAPAVVAAQVGAGQISGVIRDMAFIPVPGATVTATLIRTSAARTTVSSESGSYTLPGLAPGEYRIDVELPGFRPVRREGLRVETGESILLDVVLVLGELTDAVTVVADAPMLRANASLGQVVSQEKVEGLCLVSYAFSIAPQFTLGTASRNPVRGPSYRNVDIALSRRVPFRRGTFLEVRVEVFNALNDPALGNPNGAAGTAAFGSITTAGDPRVTQLALKYSF